MRRDLLAAVALCASLFAASSVAKPTLDLGFSDGVRPLDLPDAPAPEECGGCHKAEYADWQTTMHKAAWTAPVFQAGFIVEPLEVCVNCHAPLPEQQAEIAANAAWYTWQDPHTRQGPEPAKAPEPHAEQGITCAVCHVRDGAVLASHDDDAAPHAIRVEPGLAESTLCASCHQFNSAAVRSTDRGDEIVITGEPMQTTWSEWARSDAGRGGDTCQSCHMPGGRHLFRGAHDRDLLRASLAVEATRRGDLVTFALSSVGTGHDLPTGDLFRHLTVEVDRGPGWEEVDRVGRTFALRHRAGGAVLAETSDTRLRPGVVRRVKVEADQPLRWRVVWHDTSERDEAHARVPLAETTLVLAEGER